MGSVCPTKAFCSYFSLRGSAPGPLFIFTDGRPLTWQQLSSSVQSILNKAEYFGSYSGHSFRIGAATTAAAWEFQITLSRPSGVGLAMHTVSISALQLVPLSAFPTSWWLNR